jgi:hypothetical protein
MGAYTEIVDYTVPSDTTSVVLDDFGTITKDDFIKVVMTTIPSGGGFDLNVTANGNNTQTNYHRQYVLAGGSSVSAARNNRAAIDAPEVNGVSSNALFYLKLSENDRYNLFSNSTRRNDSSIQNIFQYVTSSGATFSSGITSLTFTASSNQIGTGSRIQIYRLDAEKVADITVASNSTQVDIPVTGSLDPAINKDSEYLLVYDIDSAFSNATTNNLFPNDLTTATDYYRQEIFGTGSTAGAGRNNNARFSETSSTRRRDIGYIHIKLSEIGAFTFQGYGILGPGTTGLILVNQFVSSTAENFTSITKLNIVSNVTNNIASGSRFILYKLK